MHCHRTLPLPWRSVKAPSEMPRRRRRRWLSGRGRIILILAVVAFFFLIISLRGIARFYTDFLWFDFQWQYPSNHDRLYPRMNWKMNRRHL